MQLLVVVAESVEQFGAALALALVALTRTAVALLAGAFACDWSPALRAVEPWPGGVRQVVAAVVAERGAHVNHPLTRALLSASRAAF